MKLAGRSQTFLCSNSRHTFLLEKKTFICQSVTEYYLPCGISLPGETTHLHKPVVTVLQGERQRGPKK